jgi:hypothetical protein
LIALINDSSAVDLVFYRDGEFPPEWDGSADDMPCPDIESFKKTLMISPIFGKGSYLGPRYYEEHALRTFSLLQAVEGEPVFFWDKDAKKEDVTGLDEIIIRGTQLVHGRWVVYYSIPHDHPHRLYGMLYGTFQHYARIHTADTDLSGRYAIVIGGPDLSAIVSNIFSS